MLLCFALFTLKELLAPICFAMIIAILFLGFGKPDAA
jgi:hypothetical protein